VEYTNLSSGFGREKFQDPEKLISILKRSSWAILESTSLPEDGSIHALMAKCDFTLHSFIIVRMEIEPATLIGIGGPEYPRLLVPLKISLNPYAQHANQKDDLLILGLRGELALELQQKISDSVSRPFVRLVREFPSEAWAHLEFPLASQVLERIEETRQGDLRFRCDFQLEVTTFGTLRFGGNPDKALPSLPDIHALTTDCVIEVPQSVWIEKVLPGLGYGKVYWIELPAISLEACAELDHSFKALQQAERRFKFGDYDEAVAHCRKALEPIRRELQKLKTKSGDALAPDYAEKIGNSTVTWLTEVLGKTYGVANTPAHSPQTGHFNRLDAQMLLTITASVIAFLARSGFGQDKQKPKSRKPRTPEAGQSGRASR